MLSLLALTLAAAQPAPAPQPAEGCACCKGMKEHMSCCDKERSGKSGGGSHDLNH